MGFLTDIVARKQREVAERQRTRPLDELEMPPAPSVRDFAAALRKPGIAVIAEIKRRSPAKGPLREDLDVPSTARAYARNRAAALSVLTDRDLFGGCANDLRLARRAVELPVLRKDFTIDAYQVHEARHIGADAVLLIARILSDPQIRDYLRLARELSLAALVEIHDQTELARALDCGARIIGVNNRNLETFAVNLDTALQLKDDIPAECIAVAESGIRTRDDVQRLEAAGYNAILVGEALIRSPDPGIKLAELRGATT